jgi:hypothetical protein
MAIKRPHGNLAQTVCVWEKLFYEQPAAVKKEGRKKKIYNKI